MKVSELIDQLKSYDQEALIVIQDPNETMTLHEIESFGYVPTREGKTVAINAQYFPQA
jgi:hypothetical protein